MSVLPVLVVGLGHPDRGDDAVGGVVARWVGVRAGGAVEVVHCADPTDLALLWAGRQRAVVVDAVSSGGSVRPGTVHVLRTGAGLPALAEDAWTRTGRGGTHAFGLAAAVELARVLRRLPDDVVVVGVEAGGFEHRARLTPAVGAAVPAAVEAVLRAAQAGDRADVERVVSR